MHKAWEKKVLLAPIISLVGYSGISVTPSPKLLSVKTSGYCSSVISNSADLRTNEPSATNSFGVTVPSYFTNQNLNYHAGFH